MKREKYKCILWGTGVDAERFLYRERDYADILYCIDSNREEMFHGFEVRKP